MQQTDFEDEKKEREITVKHLTPVILALPIKKNSWIWIELFVIKKLNVLFVHLLVLLHALAVRVFHELGVGVVDPVSHFGTCDTSEWEANVAWVHCLVADQSTSRKFDVWFVYWRNRGWWQAPMLRLDRVGGRTDCDCATTNPPCKTHRRYAHNRAHSHQSL